MYDIIFIGIVSEQGHLCRCYDNNALVSCYAEGVSFGDKISDVHSKFLSLEGLSVQVLF